MVKVRCDEQWFWQTQPVPLLSTGHTWWLRLKLINLAVCVCTVDAILCRRSAAKKNDIQLSLRSLRFGAEDTNHVVSKQKPSFDVSLEEKVPTKYRSWLYWLGCSLRVRCVRWSAKSGSCRIYSIQSSPPVIDIIVRLKAPVLQTLMHLSQRLGPGRYYLVFKAPWITLKVAQGVQHKECLLCCHKFLWSMHNYLMQVMPFRCFEGFKYFTLFPRFWVNTAVRCVLVWVCTFVKKRTREKKSADSVFLESPDIRVFKFIFKKWAMPRVKNDTAWKVWTDSQKQRKELEGRVKLVVVCWHSV